MSTISEDSGYTIPEVAYIDKPKTGFFWRFVRFVGKWIVDFGAFIYSLAFKKVEIYPRRAITEILAEIKSERK